MKIGDIVYVFHRDTACEVDIKSDFVLSNKPMWGKDRWICSAKYLKRFTMETGWVPYINESKANPTRDTFSTRKSSCYATKTEALEAIKKGWQEVIKSAENSQKCTMDNLLYAQKTLEDTHMRLAQLKQLNVEAIFGEGEKYISIFTNQER